MLLKTVALALAAASVSAQTFRRAAGCPTLGCLYPPDQAEFIAGSVFDIRLEAQAPINGTTPYNNGVPNANFSLTIQHVNATGAEPIDVAKFFNYTRADETTTYNFTYFEDLFSRDAKKATQVFVAAKSYRHVALYLPGEYVATFTYNGGAKTVARWTVLPLAKKRQAKNVILFVGDGMTTSMITAARLLGHKSINGKYQTTMAMDKAVAYGSQMTHSLDSFITDSANSATALYSGKKSTVNALNVYTDSSADPFSDPKFETVFEMFRRQYNGRVGIVSTANLADATLAATVTHTAQRGQFAGIVTQFLNGITATPWTRWNGPDVLMGGGAELFLPNKNNQNISQYPLWAAKNFSIVHDKTALLKASNSSPLLGTFQQGNMNVWLDRNVYKETLNSSTSWNGTKGVFDLPGLKDMTIKAIDVLVARSKAMGNTGFMLMSEAASIDKQMHSLDYHRALGDLLELDQTVAATLEHLAKIGELEDTLVIVTADHGHGFDVFGSADTSYLEKQTTDRKKRDAVGIYQSSGLSEYQVNAGSLPDNHTASIGLQGPGFPSQWAVRYGIAAGMAAGPDHREDYKVRTNMTRDPATPLGNETTNYYVNGLDGPNGFVVNGTLPVSSDSGVHSLTDVPVYAWGPGHELFRGVYNSPDIAHKIAFALNLGRNFNATMIIGEKKDEKKKDLVDDIKEKIGATLPKPL